MHPRLSKFKRSLKRLYRFFTMGGLAYISWHGIKDFVRWKYRAFHGSGGRKKIYWIGPFSPSHANVGDHAQTLGVKKHLENNFYDYDIVRVYRDDINLSRLEEISGDVRSSDLILIHSSGDFGSLHDVDPPYPGRLSFPEVRRQLVSMLPTRKIINLPVTAYYEDNEKGRLSIENDRGVFNDSHYTVLCREPVSLATVQSNLDCCSLFFPDFVFYLNPRPIKGKRFGVQVILRSDREAVLSENEKNKLVRGLAGEFDRVIAKDIMHEYHVIPDLILERYMECVFIQFQSRELIITDKMHGMISAVITHTPCIVLSGGIPHKIQAYKSFLSDAVEFVDTVEDINDAIIRIREKEYTPVDLKEYFERFRSEIVQV